MTPDRGHLRVVSPPRPPRVDPPTEVAEAGTNMEDLERWVVRGGRGARMALPPTPGTEPLPREPRWKTIIIRISAILALVAGLAYLSWRATAGTIDMDVWWVSVPLFVLECWAWLELAHTTAVLWDVNPTADPIVVDKADGRVAILIPTYNEGPEILVATIAAAVACRVQHETWVLDDGRRPWVREMALKLGAYYLTRPDNAHAKAGNLNHALTVTGADYIAVFDADHIAQPDALETTLGYFRDPKVALVQTPHGFYNTGSFEHMTGAWTRRFSEQSMFFRVIQAGRNRLGGAFWCGSSGVLRVSALESIGGIATETITEDQHTTLKLAKTGWSTVYHNRVIARGLATANAAQFLLSRYRWSAGTLQMARVDPPLWTRGLTLGQRIAYACGPAWILTSWRTLGFMVIPIVSLLTGAIPIKTEPATFAIFFGSMLTLQLVAGRLLHRGYLKFVAVYMFDLVRLAANLRATWALVSNKPMPFQVTPKGSEGDERKRIRPSRLLSGLAITTAVAIGMAELNLVGWGPVHYPGWPLPVVTGTWCLFNLFALLLAIRRITAIGYGSERRAAVRFEGTPLNGLFLGEPCLVHDVSMTGARISMLAHAPLVPAFRGPLEHARSHRLTVAIGDESIDLQVVIRSRRIAFPAHRIYGLELLPGQQEKQAQLARSILGAQIEADRIAALRDPSSAVAAAAVA